MIEDLQLAQHLEADTLSAFAEGVLPPHEREAALAHLAVCPACREIVQLAMPPFEEAQTVLQPAKPGFAGWRWLWAGAAACAGVALVTVALLRSPAPDALSPSTMARVEQQPLPSAPPAAGVPAPQPAPAMAPPAVVSRPARKPLPPAPAASASPQPYASAGAAAPEPTFNSQADKAPLEQRSAKSLVQVPNSVHGRLNGFTDQNALPPAAAPRSRASAGIRLDAEQPAPQAAPAPAPAPAPPANSETVQVQSQAVAIESTNAIVAQRLPELPSHLPTASSYAQGKRLVAADTAGTVFFSKDAGHHWKSAEKAWEGRVVRVGPPQDITPATGATTYASATTESKTAPAFALITDSGQRWVSADGKKWTQH